MTRTAFLVMAIVITLTLGASATVIVMTEQNKASAATSDASSYKDKLIESQDKGHQTQTQLDLTREVLTRTQAELEKFQDGASKLQNQNTICGQVGQLTTYMMNAVKRQARAVNLAIKKHPAMARQVLLRVADDLNKADRILRRSGHTKVNEMLAACEGAK